MSELFRHLYDVSSENIDALQTRWTLILRKAGKGPIGTHRALYLVSAYLTLL